MYLIYKIKDIYKALYTFDKEFLKNNGITLNEVIVLYSLSEKDGFYAGYLSDQLGLSNSRVSRILFRLENKGYISRKIGEVDKRQVFFYLTKQGKQKRKNCREERTDTVNILDY